ncbi:unnamed protein product [Lathyrus sativus]|nr:unnamed protein product [Lathyrus sativus]
MIDNINCCFCTGEESLNHLFFECLTMRNIWMEVLDWIQLQHIPGDWNQELIWLTQQCKGKGRNVAMIKLSITETAYELWKLRNEKSFSKVDTNNRICNRIIESIMYKGWNNLKLRKYIASLMVT